MSLEALVLKWMLQAEPKAPWKDTFPKTAAAIAKASIDSPVFAGSDGAERTAVVLVAISKFESSFKPDAAGDCEATDPKTGMCAIGSKKPTSFCAFQISESNFPALGVTKEQMLTDINVCTRAAIRLLRASFRVCAGVPLEERLRQYAAGGGTCSDYPDAIRKSQHRMNYAQFLFKRIPPSSVTPE